MTGPPAPPHVLGDARRAWAAAGSGDVVGADVVTDGGKSTVFRLWLTGAPTRAIIAKRTSAVSVALERTVYSDVLWQIGVDAARYLGWAPDGDPRLAWLFLEDVTGQAPDRVDDAAAAGRWLAAMHVSSLGLPGTRDLPDRDADHHRARLHTARQRLIARLEADLNQQGNEVNALEIAIQVCDRVEASWPDVAAFTESLPRVLVHGDFSPENLRLRLNGGRRTLVAIDWEKAGWGTAPTDLGWVDIDAYLSAVRPAMPSMSQVDADLLKASGALFRVLSHDWARKGVKKMSQFAQRLRIATGTFERGTSSRP